MEMWEVAENFLIAYQQGDEIPGGLHYRKALGQCRLDGSMDSLKRIDMLLDQIRSKQAPEFDTFRREQPTQNFLYFLAFYVGNTVAANSGAELEWWSYDELLAQDPGVAAVWPRQFESSIVCRFRKPGSHKQMLPLVPIVVRLFEGPDEKSVWFSAQGFL